MKKYLKLITGFALVAAISVGATLAYLQADLGTKNNKFISNKSISGELTEPGWTGGTTGIPENGSWNYLPNEEHGKDPKISIHEGSVDAYVAIKIDFIDENGNLMDQKKFENTYAKVYYGGKNNVPMTQGINPEWKDATTKELGNSKLFVFGEMLSANQTSATLFDIVKVNQDITNAEKTGLPSFEIRVTGYAVQAEQITQEEAITELVKMATTTKN